MGSALDPYLLASLLRNSLKARRLSDVYDLPTILCGCGTSPEFFSRPYVTCRPRATRMACTLLQARRYKHGCAQSARGGIRNIARLFGYQVIGRSGRSFVIRFVINLFIAAFSFGESTAGGLFVCLMLKVILVASATFSR